MHPLIDLHCHVLPGIDDGPETLADSLALLQAMAEQGVRTVVATPHAGDGRYEAQPDQVLAAVEAVNLAARAAGIAVEVLPGMELTLSFDTLTKLRATKALTIAGTQNVCVELPRTPYAMFVDRAMFELMLAGYRPILVHPERNPGIQEHPELMDKLAERGVVGLLTAGSLLGRHGSTAERLAARFLKGGSATLIASDAHDLNRRPPQLAAALEAARALGKIDQCDEWALIGRDPAQIVREA